MQGEGETKIMQRMNNNPASAHASHVIFGNDSDIILMALMSPVKQLYILSQQTMGRKSSYHCISLDAVNSLWKASLSGGARNGVSCTCCQTSYATPPLHACPMMTGQTAL